LAECRDVSQVITISAPDFWVWLILPKTMSGVIVIVSCGF
jgi:hypothetical protein